MNRTGEMLVIGIVVILISLGVLVVALINRDLERAQLQKKIICHENFQYRVGQEGAFWIETYKGVPLHCNGGNRVIQ